MIRHYYHVWADGAWEEPLYEHVTAMDVAGLDCDMTVGVVGAEANRIAVLVAVGELPGAVEAESGHEQVTLARLHEDACTHPEDVFLYTHAKGAYHPSSLNTMWRRSMTALCVLGWRKCVDLLRDHDAAGCHWVHTRATPEDDYSIFAGNFWWATGRYLATLPSPAQWDDRFEAERWIGRGSPVVADLRPDWPNPAMFEPDDDPALAAQFGPFWLRWRFGLPEPRDPEPPPEPVMPSYVIT